MKKLILNKRLSVISSVARRPSVTSNGVRSLFLPFCFLLSTFCLFSGCDCADCQEKVVPQEQAFFNVTPPRLSFTDEVLQKTFTVSSSMDWTLITTPEGFTYSVTEGKPGLTVVTVTMTDFPGGIPVTVWAQASNGDTKPVVLEYIWNPIPPPPPGPFLFPGNVTSYVGAYWRAEETGERIIRIKDMNTLGNNGAWTASVTWLDGRWGNDRPVLGNATLAELLARGIYSDTPGNAEDHPVTTRTTKVTGTTSEGAPDIIFRVGVTQKFTEAKGFIPDGPTAPNYSTTWPARYGIITVSYNNNTKSFNIYLRQGEGADYVMRPEDLGGGGESWGTPNPRPAAARFSPYNLTATTLNADPGYRGGVFTEYPSQAGAFFHWANTSYPRYTWDPFSYSVTWSYTFLTGAANCWTGSSNPSAVYETCPAGYHRPNNGSTSVIVSTNDVVGSELRQSLWLNPNASTTDNSVWGFYADGFFDRRFITTSQATGAVPNVSVAVLSKEIAHIGRLCYNPTTKASLFLNAAGTRTPSGTLDRSGLYTLIWSSTTVVSGGWWCFNINASAMEWYGNGDGRAMIIRCAKD